MDSLDLGATIRGFSANQKVFGRYTLKKILGRGGMGVVWLARDEELERDVALKFLPEIVAMDREAIRDLKRETRRSLDLTHSHIVRIYDFIQDTRTAAISMEYVAGDTLAARKIDQPRGCFDPVDLREWVKQLCEALDYAHGKAQIVHRDLKPANLMIDARGDLKIADFGIAASVCDSVSRVSAQAGSSGTPVYMSPQQMMGEKTAVTDDIYAVGATLYELLTGKPPFYAGNVMLQVQSKVPPAMAERRTELGEVREPIPPEWEETIAACLAKEASERPQSAGEVAERLGLIGGVKVMPKPAAKVAVAEPVVAAAVKSAEPAEEVEESKPKSKTGLYAGLAAAALMLGGAGFYFGVYAPEQARLAEVARLEAEGKQAEALKLKTDGELKSLLAARLAAARGGVIVKTIPAGAEVTVGALEHATSPVTIKEAKLGKYPVKVRLAGYEDYAGEVEVKENAFAEVDATLVRSTGSVAITSEPSGLSYVLSGNEKTERGTTPAKVSAIPTGDYTVTLARSGWPEVKQTLRVERGAEARTSAEFPSGALEITSVPSGAEVYFEGEKAGVTPLSFRDSPPIMYAYELRLKGYKAATVSGEVKPGETARASAVLEKTRRAEEGQAWTIPELNLTLMPIAAGTFTMGTAVGGRDNEKPVTRVTITKPYWLGKTEVTQGEWEAVMGSNPSEFKGANLPLETVSWTEAMEFCRKLTAREGAAERLPEGYVYTLPTEAQWEYACRAGITGDHAGELDAMGWYTQNSGNMTNPVGTKRANAWGLHDMHGNVFEWCADWFASYAGGSVRDPQGPSSGSDRVCRGGGWRVSADLCRSADRDYEGSGNRGDGLGFRLALSSVP